MNIATPPNLNLLICVLLVIQLMERLVGWCLVSGGDEVAEADNRCQSRCSRQPNDEIGNLGCSLITSWVKWHMERSKNMPCWCCELHTTDVGLRLSGSVQRSESVIFTSFFSLFFRKLLSIGYNFFTSPLFMQRQQISGWYFFSHLHSSFYREGYPMLHGDVENFKGYFLVKNH